MLSVTVQQSVIPLLCLHSIILQSSVTQLRFCTSLASISCCALSVFIGVFIISLYGLLCELDMKEELHYTQVHKTLNESKIHPTNVNSPICYYYEICPIQPHFHEHEISLEKVGNTQPSDFLISQVMGERYTVHSNLPRNGVGLSWNNQGWHPTYNCFQLGYFTTKN